MTNKWFKLIMLILFLLFLGLYFSSNAGLIDYQAKYKTSLTEKQIKQFEEDVNNNINVDIKDYIDVNNKRHSNNISKTTLKISNTIGKMVKNTLNIIFEGLESVMNK